MRQVFYVKEWIKELVKRNISKFDKKDLKGTDLDKPNYFYNVAHRNGWIYRVSIKWSISTWTLTNKAKML